MSNVYCMFTILYNFLKAAICISKSCHTTALLDGFEIHKIYKHIRIQELGLLKSSICSTSSRRTFYKYLIDCLFTDNYGKGKAQLHRVLTTYVYEEQRSPSYNTCVGTAIVILSVIEILWHQRPSITQQKTVKYNSEAQANCSLTGFLYKLEFYIRLF